MSVVYILECTHKNCRKYFICETQKDAEKIKWYEDCDFEITEVEVITFKNYIKKHLVKKK